MFLVAEYLSPKKLNLSNYCTITYNNNNTEKIIMYINKIYVYMYQAQKVKGYLLNRAPKGGIQFRGFSADKVVPNRDMRNAIDWK